MPTRPGRCLLMMGAALIGVSGCQSTGARLLSLIGLKKEPLAIALVMDARPAQAIEALNPFPRYARLQKALEQELGRPVGVDPCYLFQAESGLKSGWYQLAILTPAQYAQLAARDELEVLVAPVDRQGRVTQRALLVVPAQSSVERVLDLRGEVVAFGPPNDTLTHRAALRLLREAGLSKTDLALEAFPVPGSLKHFSNATAVAQSVINGSSAAGFIDQAAWEAFPEHAEREGQPARDQLRVLAQTTALPKRLMVAAPALDANTRQSIRAFLVAVGKQQPEALEPLKIAGYAVLPEDALAACRTLLVTDAATESEAPDTMPATEE